MYIKRSDWPISKKAVFSPWFLTGCVYFPQFSKLRYFWQRLCAASCWTCLLHLFIWFREVFECMNNIIWYMIVDLYIFDSIFPCKVMWRTTTKSFINSSASEESDWIVTHSRVMKHIRPDEKCWFIRLGWSASAFLCCDTVRNVVLRVSRVNRDSNGLRCSPPKP